MARTRTCAAPPANTFTDRNRPVRSYAFVDNFDKKVVGASLAGWNDFSNNTDAHDEKTHEMQSDLALARFKEILEKKKAANNGELPVDDGPKVQETFKQVTNRKMPGLDVTRDVPAAAAAENNAAKPSASLVAPHVQHPAPLQPVANGRTPVSRFFPLGPSDDVAHQPVSAARVQQATPPQHADRMQRMRASACGPYSGSFDVDRFSDKSASPPPPEPVSAWKNPNFNPNAYGKPRVNMPATKAKPVVKLPSTASKPKVQPTQSSTVTMPSTEPNRRNANELVKSIQGLLKPATGPAAQVAAPIAASSKAALTDAPVAATATVVSMPQVVVSNAIDGTHLEVSLEADY